MGIIREIIVVSPHNNIIEPITRQILQQNIYTPQPEPEFVLRFEDTARLRAFLNFHLMFIVGTTKDEVIQKLLGDRVNQVEKDTFKLIVIPEPWAKNQKVLVFVSKDESLLVSGMAKYSKRIRHTFQQWIVEQMRKITYEKGHNKQLKDLLLTRYGFGLDLPASFRLVDKYEFDKFIYLVAHNPDRSIFCYYEAGTKPLAKDNLLSFRDSLTFQFYEGDSVVKNLTIVDTVQFFNGSALKLKGVWQNQKLAAGGPFISYCFNYQNRFYYIDGSVYNPGKYKLDNLNQVDVILQTFELK